MRLNGEESLIRWRLHLAASPATVYDALSSDEGRERFWAQRSAQRGDMIEFEFPGGERLEAHILDRTPGTRFELSYFSGSRVRFDLEDDGAGGCDLTLTERLPPSVDRDEQLAGWVSVLMALKGAVDFHVDLRNHDESRSWRQGYVDN